MKIIKIFLITTLFLTSLPIFSDDKKLSIKMNNVEYLNRWSKETLFEFTPKGQEDLKTWTDMISITPFNTVKKTEELTEISKKLYNAYQQIKNVPIKFYSLPKDSTEPNEHVIIVLLITPEYIECVFARLMFHEKQGLAIIYSHKVYGNKAGNETSSWLKENGETIEKELLKVKDLPSLADLNKLVTQK